MAGDDKTENAKPDAEPEEGATPPLVPSKLPPVGMGVLRLAVVWFALAYLYTQSYTNFTRCMMASFVANFFRLGERVGMPKYPGLTMYLARAMGEDSFHNMLYVTMLIAQVPSYLFVISPTFFAFFQSIQFLRQLSIGLIPRWKSVEKVENKLFDFSKAYSDKAYAMVANCEVAIMVMFIMKLFTRPSLRSVMDIAMYSNFSMLRCMSRRNSRPRLAWGALHQTLDTYSVHPRCPSFVRQGFLASVANILKFKAAFVLPPPQ